MALVKRGLPWLWLLVAAACSYEIDEDLCTRDEHCRDREVCGVNNQCYDCSDPSCPPSDRCDGDDDCNRDEACADDGICRPACVENEQCPSDSCDYRGWCRAAFGEPCVIGGLLSTTFVCADECIDTDADLETVPSYCTMSCSDPEDCPDGYTCRSRKCRIVSTP